MNSKFTGTRYNYYRNHDSDYKAAFLVKNILINEPEGLSSVLTEEDSRLRRRGIDIIWQYMDGKNINTRNILVLSDIMITGNYFFETCADIVKQKLGRFLYSRADYLYYVFMAHDPIEIHVIDRSKLIPWFLKKFVRLHNRTMKVKKSNRVLRTSVGKEVPEHWIDEDQGWVKTIRVKQPPGLEPGHSVP